MRSRQEIDQEYASLATIFGDKTFKIEMIGKDLDVIKGKMIQLSQEPASENAPQVADTEPVANDGKCEESPAQEPAPDKNLQE